MVRRVAQSGGSAESLRRSLGLVLFDRAPEAWGLCRLSLEGGRAISLVENKNALTALLLLGIDGSA